MATIGNLAINRSKNASIIFVQNVKSHFLSYCGEIHFAENENLKFLKFRFPYISYTIKRKLTKLQGQQWCALES